MGDPETAKVHIKGAQHMMKYQRNLSLDADLWERAIVFWSVQVRRKLRSH
jgi:hypothetical protein